MSKWLRITLGVIFFFLLTLVTQVGGLVFLISILTFGYIDRKIVNGWVRIAVKGLSFVTMYLTFIFLIVPPIAKRLGRVPLPMIESHNLQPANILTCLLNRNYVKPQLREIAFG